MERIYELIQKAQKGDKEAKEIILKENSGLIWSIVKKFKGRGYDFDDLYQIGSMGLLKCIDKFDMKYEVKFSTYAVPMIMGEIKRFLRDDGLIKVSRPLKEIAVKAKYIREEMTQKNGSEPTISELAAALGTAPEELMMALESTRDTESIFQTVYQQNGSSVYLLDKLYPESEDSEKIIDIISLKEILNTLDTKERHIIIMRYFKDKTQSEIAKEMGISQVQVSRIEKRVLKNIREKFK